MRRGHHCRCCGLGLALGNFQGVHSPWNYYSWIVGLDTYEDEDGWTVGTRPADFTKAPAFVELDPWRDSVTPIRPFRPRLSRFAYRVDKPNEKVQIEITIAMEAAGDLGWQWKLEYELTFQEYDTLIAEGRLRLNDHMVKATHSGNPTVADSFFELQPTDTQNGWGDFILVWPRFAADWYGKRLVVRGTTATPIKNTSALGFSPINLTWLASPFEFVFDQDSFVEEAGFYQRYYEDVQTSEACYAFFGATHFDLANTAVVQGPDRVVGIDGYQAWLRFRTGAGIENTCGGQAVDGRVSMNWQIGSVWWKAFENDGVVVSTEHKGLGRSASPVLFTESGSTVAAPLQEFDFEEPTASVFPITYTLSLLPVE